MPFPVVVGVFGVVAVVALYFVWARRSKPQEQPQEQK
jgi:hypothetical protein